MERFLKLLACPACAGALGADWSCRDCGARYDAPDGIPNLRLAADTRVDAVRRFYEHAPFPGYPPRDSLAWLRARAERSEFARLLDRAIPGDARILDGGCGTGQMSLYLARADRVVIGADLTRASLQLGAAAARRYGLEGVQFIETDLHNPGLRAGSFDVVYSSGVLHHTPDPRASFARIAQLARPGGMIVLGLYNAFARIPLRLRRLVARLSGYRVIPFDPVLRDRKNEPARRFGGAVHGRLRQLAAGRLAGAARLDSRAGPRRRSLRHGRPPRPSAGSAMSSLSVHGLVRLAVSARIVLIVPGSTGAAALPHARRMYVSTAAI